MYQLIRTVALAVFIFLTAHCDNREPGESRGASVEKTNSRSVERPGASNLPPAPRYLEAAGRLTPVYGAFDDIDPIFRRENDSLYIINFWATWCKPCVEELPYFEQLQEELAGQKAQIILVSLDFAKDLESKLIPFLEKWKLRSDVAVLLDGDYNSWIDRVDESWGGAIPATVIYNAREWNFMPDQFPNYEDLSAKVKKLL
jgi:thiol-disulfide isomerase/thioredoxin